MANLNDYIILPDRFGILILEHQNDALINVPLWHEHQKAKNWMAKVDLINGKYKRKFCKKGHPPFFYEISHLNSGDVVEFAADFVASAAVKNIKRFAGIVTNITPKLMVVRHCVSLEQAFNIISGLEPNNFNTGSSRRISKVTAYPQSSAEFPQQHQQQQQQQHLLRRESDNELMPRHNAASSDLKQELSVITANIRKHLDELEDFLENHSQFLN